LRWTRPSRVETQIRTDEHKANDIGKNRTEIAVVKEGLEFLKWVMGFLALFVIGAIAMPLMIQAWRERKESKQLETLAEVVDMLKKEVAMLKEQRIVKP